MPGSDGVPYEVYRALGGLLRPLAQVFEEAMGGGELPAGMNDNVVSLLYKGRGDRGVLSSTAAEL